MSKATLLLAILVFYAVLGVSSGFYGSWKCGLTTNETNYNDAQHKSCIGATYNFVVTALEYLSHIPLIGGVFTYLASLIGGAIISFSILPWWINTILFIPLFATFIFVLIPAEGE